MDILPWYRKWLVTGLLGLFFILSTIQDVTEGYTNPPLPGVHQQIPAIAHEVIEQTYLDGNALISNNTWDDSRPRMTTNGLNQTIIVYEKGSTFGCKQVPVVYTVDQGQTWVEQFLFDSLTFPHDGSGVLEYPDIVYNAKMDVLFFTMIDPDTEEFNVEMSFFPGDIAHATEASMYRMMGAPDGYFESACACTDNFFVALHTNGYFQAGGHIFGLGWFLYPDFYSPPNAGICWDGNLFFQSAPAAEIEMDSNVNQLFIVCETCLCNKTYITIKTNVMDEALITSGELQNGGWKYSDVEEMPGEYFGLGTDPDVSGSGNKVCVVYVENGTVICKSSTTSPYYDPGFTWQTSQVDTNASSPAVYMQGNTVYCAYVKDGNLYLKVSEDGGVIWGAAEQKNDVDGTVVAQKGSVDICKTGIAFTDVRNGNFDVYFTSYERKPTSELVITGLGPLIMTIKNIGDAPAYNINWSIMPTVKEGFLFLGKKSFSGTVLVSLEPGQEITVGQKQLLFGFGSIEILGVAWAENAPLVSDKLTGRLLLVLFTPV